MADFWSAHRVDEPAVVKERVQGIWANRGLREAISISQIEKQLRVVHLTVGCLTEGHEFPNGDGKGPLENKRYNYLINAITNY